MKNLEFEICRKLVAKFIENPKNWPQEIKMAKKLLYKCPDIEAWEELVLSNKIYSLSFFLSPEGSVFIPLSQRNPYLLDLDKLCPKSKKSLDFSVN